jgi:hypothetical protein
MWLAIRLVAANVMFFVPRKWHSPPADVLNSVSLKGLQSEWFTCRTLPLSCYVIGADYLDRALLSFRRFEMEDSSSSFSPAVVWRFFVSMPFYFVSPHCKACSSLSPFRVPLLTLWRVYLYLCSDVSLTAGALFTQTFKSHSALWNNCCVVCELILRLKVSWIIILSSLKSQTICACAHFLIPQLGCDWTESLTTSDGDCILQCGS